MPCQQPYMTGAYACPPVDIPGHRAPERVHRDSESASSVSSIATLVDKHSPAAYHHHAGPKQYRVQAAPAAVAAAAPHDVYEDDVFMAANILMSLRTCKLPC
ncbi:hypothetical protein H4R21_004723 [Coemansia helicoidea]|uniref:Uncharacterized protein n=1 Tax=Coemansia helicoidea TaxID=1286919 RepID=A0ACC1KWJ6_9FUNG|nr:hypothetical protein H4R21_004723 [Coemansia helicoidea]